jgi:hypothetical protein
VLWSLCELCEKRMDLPTTDLRKNVLTLAVPNERLPGVGRMMRSLLPAEEYDPEFAGQYLQTTYFDTPGLALRRARLEKNRYCTVRIRCYAPIQSPGRNYPEGIYALSIKTESGKFRTPLEAYLAEDALSKPRPLGVLENEIPGDLLARLYDLAGDDDLCPAVTVCFTRYAVESTNDRLTLDCGISTSNGKIFPTNVLEVKSAQQPYEPLPEVAKWGFSPIKLSKFLWATTYGVR